MKAQMLVQGNAEALIKRWIENTDQRSLLLQFEEQYEPKMYCFSTKALKKRQ